MNGRQGLLGLGALVFGCSSPESDASAPRALAGSGGSSTAGSGGSATAGEGGAGSTSAGASGTGTGAGGAGMGATNATGGTGGMKSYPPGAPGCGLEAAAFCETFDAPAGKVTRAGELDPERFSAA